MTNKLTIACVAVPLAATVALGGALADGATKKKKKAEVLKLQADPNGNFSFDKTKLSAKHGVVALVMKDPLSSGTQHGIAIKGTVNGKKIRKSGEIVDPGGTSKVKLTLKPGKYTFYCPVPGHAAAGMKGTLTVK
jgi:uncharacterized cupredoxin-like copper-binding protein